MQRAFIEFAKFIIITAAKRYAREYIENDDKRAQINQAVSERVASATKTITAIGQTASENFNDAVSEVRTLFVSFMEDVLPQEKQKEITNYFDQVYKQIKDFTQNL